MTRKNTELIQQQLIVKNELDNLLYENCLHGNRADSKHKRNQRFP